MSAALARSQLKALGTIGTPTPNANAQYLSARLGKLPGNYAADCARGSRTSSFHKYRVRMDATQIGVNLPARESARITCLRR